MERLAEWWNSFRDWAGPSFLDAPAHNNHAGHRPANVPDDLHNVDDESLFTEDGELDDDDFPSPVNMADPRDERGASTVRGTRYHPGPPPVPDYHQATARPAGSYEYHDPRMPQYPRDEWRSQLPDPYWEAGMGSSLYETPPMYPEDRRRGSLWDCFPGRGRGGRPVRAESGYPLRRRYDSRVDEGWSMEETLQSFHTPAQHPQDMSYDSHRGSRQTDPRLYTPYQSVGEVRHSTPMDHLPGIGRPSYAASSINPVRSHSLHGSAVPSRPEALHTSQQVPVQVSQLDPVPLQSQMRECPTRPTELHPVSSSQSERAPGGISTPSYPEAPVPNLQAVSSARRAPSKFFKPEKYDGSGDWGDYIDHFEQVSTWNSWSPQEKVAQLSMNLTGIARQAWCDGRGSSGLSYEALVSVLKQRFRPEGQEEAFKAEFRYRSRGPAETYLEFGHKLRRLAIRAFPSMTHSSREDLVRDQFVQNLEGEMRRHVSLAHPKTLDQAVTMASEYDAVIGLCGLFCPRSRKL